MSTDPITPADLDAWDALAKAATPGPWHTEPAATRPDKAYVLAGNDDYIEEPFRLADAAWIAAARTALPRLIAALREERAKRYALLEREAAQLIEVEHALSSAERATEIRFAAEARAEKAERESAEEHDAALSSDAGKRTLALIEAGRGLAEAARNYRAARQWRDEDIGVRRLDAVARCAEALALVDRALAAFERAEKEAT
jgi:ribosomal protein L17